MLIIAFEHLQKGSMEDLKHKVDQTRYDQRRATFVTCDIQLTGALVV